MHSGRRNLLDVRTQFGYVAAVVAGGDNGGALVLHSAQDVLKDADAVRVQRVEVFEKPQAILHLNHASISAPAVSCDTFGPLASSYERRLYPADCHAVRPDA
jgi:hypothetical protein